MEKKVQTASPVTGSAEEAKDVAQEMAQLSPDLVREYLKKDLSIAVSCLNAILSDPDLMEDVARFIFGRYENAKHKPSKIA